MSYAFTLTTHATALECRLLTKGFMGILKEFLGCSDTLHNIDLLLTEATANCVQHAYAGMKIGNVEVVLKVHPKHSIEISVSDWGIGLGSCGIDLDNPPLSVPEAEGGRGLYIIASLSDSLVFSEKQGKHSQHMTLNIKESKWVV